jgi:hypothetical protein
MSKFKYGDKVKYKANNGFFDNVIWTVTGYEIEFSTKKMIYHCATKGFTVEWMERKIHEEALEKVEA